MNKVPTDKPMANLLLHQEYKQIEERYFKNIFNLKNLNYLAREVADLNKRCLDDYNYSEEDKNNLSLSLLDLSEKINKSIEAEKNKIFCSTDVVQNQFKESYRPLKERFKLLKYDLNSSEKIQDLNILKCDIEIAIQKFLDETPECEEKNAFINNKFIPLSENITKLINPLTTMTSFEYKCPQNFSKMATSQKSSITSPLSIKPPFFKDLSEIGIKEIRQIRALEFIEKIKTIRYQFTIFIVILINGKFKNVEFSGFDSYTSPTKLYYVDDITTKLTSVKISKLQGIEFSHAKRR